MKSQAAIPFPSEKDRLLFIRFSSLGDVLLALRKANALKKRFPGLHLTWLSQVEYEGILRMQPYVDDVLPWDIGTGRLTIFRLIGRIRRENFRFLYSVHANDRSALVSAFCGIPIRVGTHKNLPFAYDYPPFVADRAWRLQEADEEETVLHISLEQREKIRQKLSGRTDRLLFCAIGASKAFKRWPSKSWIPFLEEAGRAGLVPVLVGSGSEERRMAEEIVSCCSAGVINLIGKLSLEEVCALAASSELAVGGDTGPIHLARMTGIPCIGLFAVRDPARYGHKGKNLFPMVSETPYEVYPEKVPKTCPLASIPPEEVVRRMLNIASPRLGGAGEENGPTAG